MRKTLLIKVFATVFAFMAAVMAVAQGKVHYNYDYSQTLVMKIILSVPDQQGGTKVFNNFEDALRIIKAVDNLTLQVPKIVYLVGATYNGHDDKYPAFFEVNKALKRPQDSTAEQSLFWLMKEARKYHTIVSLHINMTEAYTNSPLWKTYVENDLIAKRRFGKLKKVGTYNGIDAYQINYKNEWEKGFAQMRIDSLLKVFPPLKEAGTIHIDAWIARPDRGHHSSEKEQQEYQKKVARYWRKKGIDVTSEWVMKYMTGLVPFAWHFNGMMQEDYLQIPANVYTGSGLNPDVKGTDFGLGFLFGKSTYGENKFPSYRRTPGDTTWYKAFEREFFLNNLQYFYLNRLKRIKVTGKGKKRTAYFSGGVTVSLADSTVRKGDLLLREKDFVFFPLVWKKEKMIGTYSDRPVSRKMVLPESWEKIKTAMLYKVTPAGLVFVKKLPVSMGKIMLEIEGEQGYVIKAD
jgi:hypothetical protein